MNGPRKIPLNFGNAADSGGTSTFDLPKVIGDYQSQNACNKLLCNLVYAMRVCHIFGNELLVNAIGSAVYQWE